MGPSSVTLGVALLGLLMFVWLILDKGDPPDPNPGAH